jgi:hypothetical protein
MPRSDLIPYFPLPALLHVPVRVMRMPPMGSDCVENFNIRPAAHSPRPAAGSSMLHR